MRINLPTLFKVGIFFILKILSLFLNRQLLRITFKFYITKFISPTRTFTNLYKNSWPLGSRKLLSSICITCVLILILTRWFEKILLTIKCTGTKRDRYDENSNNYTSFSKNITPSSFPIHKCDLKTNHRCYTLYTSTQCYNSISSF